MTLSSQIQAFVGDFEPKGRPIGYTDRALIAEALESFFVLEQWLLPSDYKTEADERQHAVQCFLRETDMASLRFAELAEFVTRLLGYMERLEQANGIQYEELVMRGEALKQGQRGFEDPSPTNDDGPAR